MDYFTPIEGGQAVIYAKPGTYRQVGLYERGGKLFAKYGAGFVKIFSHGGTSHPSVKCDASNIDLGDSGYHLVSVQHEWRVSTSQAKAA